MLLKAGYYPMKGRVLRLGKLTLNRTLYDREFGENAIRRIKSEGLNLGGWLGHWTSNAVGRVLYFNPESFSMDGDWINASGWVKYNEDTAPLLDDLYSGVVDQIPVSIASKVHAYKENPIAETGQRQISFIDGTIMRIDAVDVASSEGAGLTVDFENMLDVKPQQLKAPIESFESYTHSEGLFTVDESNFDPNVLSSLSTPSVKQEGAEPPKTAEKVEQGVNAQEDKKTSLQGSSEATQQRKVQKMPQSENNQTNESVNSDATQSVQTAQATQSESAQSGLGSVFDGDVEKKRKAQYEAFMKSQRESAHSLRINQFLEGARNVYSEEGVNAISQIMTFACESAASALGVEVSQLTDSQVQTCALKARESYMSQQKGESVAGRLGRQQGLGSTSILSPSFVLGDSLIAEFNQSESFGGRFAGITWESVVNDPKARAFIIENLKREGHKIQAGAKSYTSIVKAYESIVKPRRVAAEGMGQYSEDMPYDVINSLRSVEGLTVESSPVDAEFHGSPTVYAELTSCLATVITALCLVSNPLMRMLKKMKSNRIVRIKYDVCRPDSADLVRNEVTLGPTDAFEIYSNGIMVVSIKDETDPVNPVYVELNYGSDYITFQGDDPSELSVMIINSALFDGNPEADFLIETLPKTDACGVPILINARREQVEVRGEHLLIGVPFCDIALSAFIDNYGVNILDSSLEVAVSMIDEYWTDLIMKKIEQAANYCFATDVKQAVLESQVSGNPVVMPEYLMPTWNASSVPYQTGGHSNQSYAELINLAHSLRHKCNGIDKGAKHIVMPVEMRNLLAGWAISSMVNNQQGNIASGPDSMVTYVSNMKAVTTGNCTIETVTYQDATGADVNVSVYVGNVYLLGANALHGGVKQITIKDEGQISRVTTYTCDSTGEKQDVIMSTGQKTKNIAAYGRFYVDHAEVAVFRVVMPVVAGNNCGTWHNPKISQI